MAIVNCGNCRFNDADVIDYDCKDGFLVKLLSIEPGLTPGTTALTYELCGCGIVINRNLNQAFFGLCPPDQESALNIEATKAANNPSEESNFVGIFDPGQGGNQLSVTAAKFTSLNEKCQTAVLVYDGTFDEGDLTDISVQGSFPRMDVIVSVLGLSVCEEEEGCECGPDSVTGTAATLTLPAGTCLDFTGTAETAYCFRDLAISCTDCTTTQPVEFCGVVIPVDIDLTSIEVSGIADVLISRPVTGDCESSAALSTAVQPIPFTLRCIASEDFDCEAFEQAFTADPCDFLTVSTTIVGDTVTPVISIDCDAVRNAGTPGNPGRSCNDC